MDKNERFVPKMEWGFEDKILGPMIAHSVLQGSLGFASIHPAIYAQIMGKSYDFEDLPNAEDILKHTGNMDLLELWKR